MTGNPAARLLVRAVFVAAVALSVELLARGALSVLELRDVRYEPILGDRLSAPNRQAIENFLSGRESPFQLDRDLGWTLRPGFRAPTVALQVTIDAVGRRRAPDRPPPEMDAVRLAAFGDSFTFGGYVADNYWACHEHLALDADALTRLAENSIQAAFLSEPRRAGLLAEIAAVRHQFKTTP